MSIIDDIQLILGLLQQQRTAVSFESHSFRLEDSNCEQAIRHFLDEYESLKNVAARATLVLVAVRDELEEGKARSHQNEAQLDSRKCELHNAQQMVEKLQDKINHFEQEEDSLRDQINNLHLALSEKEKEAEQRDDLNSALAAQLREENSLLQQHIEDICVKYKNLEIIAQQEATKRHKLQEEVAGYRRQEREMEAAITSLNFKLNLEMQSRAALEQELREREVKMGDLQERLADNVRELMEEVSEYEHGHEAMDIDESELAEMATDLKLLQLSEQIAYNETPLVNLNFSECSDDANQEHAKPAITNQDRLNQFFHKNDEETNQRSLRKVASNVELSSRKKIVHKQIVHWEPSEDASQDHPSMDAKAYINNITSRAENRLKDLYQINSSKVIIETQGTDRECETDRSMLPDEEKPFRRADSLRSNPADPYYIHYQLTVQSIKIEEDEEGIFGILELDMKPYYQELMASKLSLSKWAEWIRTRLLSLSEEQEDEWEGEGGA